MLGGVLLSDTVTVTLQKDWAPPTSTTTSKPVQVWPALMPDVNAGRYTSPESPSTWNPASHMSPEEAAPK